MYAHQTPQQYERAEGIDNCSGALLALKGQHCLGDIELWCRASHWPIGHDGKRVPSWGEVFDQ